MPSTPSASPSSAAVSKAPFTADWTESSSGTRTTSCDLHFLMHPTKTSHTSVHRSQSPAIGFGHDASVDGINARSSTSVPTSKAVEVSQELLLVLF